MIKEIVIPTFARKDIKTISIGIFPSKGRYFRKKMERKNNYFIIELDLPFGLSYYQIFINNNFTNAYLDINTVVDPINLISKNPIYIGSEKFGHLDFSNDDIHISRINEDIVELKAISFFGWVTDVILVDQQLIEYNFKIIYQYKNKKYWTIRIKKKLIPYYAIRFGNSEKSFWFIERNSVLPYSKNAFYFKLPQLIYYKTNKRFKTGYQILPDRFNISGINREIDWLTPWGDSYDFYKYFGGNISGIIEKLDYLKEINIDFIYLNPIFKSKSYHRYDTIDYLEIDPILGTKNDFKRLIKKAHKIGLKVILDISINHCSTDFFAFNDLLVNQEKSCFKNWFIISSFPISMEKCNYSCWHGYKELPQFNLNNIEVQNYLIRAASYWTKEFNIDGWRIDVSSELPDEFMFSFIKSLKQINSSLLFIGENIHNNYDFCSTTRGDGITSYGLYQNVFYPFFVKEDIEAKELFWSLFDFLYSHSTISQTNSWNFLSNHDLPRFLSIIKNKEDILLAYTLLFFIPGIPIIYYEEEYGLLRDKSDNRNSMNWKREKENYVFTTFISSISKIRKEYFTFFEQGTFEVYNIDIDMKIFLIKRVLNSLSICCIMNFSLFDFKILENTKIKLKENYTILFGESASQECLIVKSKNIIIYYN